MSEENINSSVENEARSAELSEEKIQNEEVEVENQPEVAIQEDETVKMQYQVAELQDKYLRLYSEFENFRRRTNKEKLDIIELANEGLILEILNVVDDLERAIKWMDTSNDAKSSSEGILLVYNKLKKILEEKGLKEIDCIGKDYDPDLHEAITKIPAPSKKLKGKIVDAIQKGYFMKSKVIRHSKVVVGE